MPLAYGGETIKLHGYFMGLLEYKGRLISGKIYVSKKGDSIISWLHQRDLGVYLDPNSDPPILLRDNVNVVEEAKDDKFVQSLVDEFPNAFKKRVGCLKGYQHKIKLKNGGVPVCSKVRNVPLSVREDMEKETEKLKKGGIIEEVEGTE